MKWPKVFRSKRQEGGGRLSYASSPLLATPTPVGRSRLLLALVGLGFVALAARAFYVQVYAEDFFQAQGDSRMAAQLELPASRGRIQDRNGQAGWWMYRLPQRKRTATSHACSTESRLAPAGCWFSTK